MLKFLNADIIYPIANTKCVSPTQVGPKKTRVTITRNEDTKRYPLKLLQVGICALITAY